LLNFYGFLPFREFQRTHSLLFELLGEDLHLVGLAVDKEDLFGVVLDLADIF